MFIHHSQNVIAQKSYSIFLLYMRAELKSRRVLEVTAFCLYTCIHTHPFNNPLSGATRVSRYQKGKSNLDFTEARDSEWQWHQLGDMQVCTSFQTDNHASNSPLSFLQAGCPSRHETNSIKAHMQYSIKIKKHASHGVDNNFKNNSWQKTGQHLSE